jgi:predicted amidophosphoribosyltransferase
MRGHGIKQSPNCLHCGSDRPHCRNLCWACYKKPEIRAAYPPLRIIANPRRTRQPRGPCAHCGERIAWARGICHRCYDVTAIRVLYGRGHASVEPTEADLERIIAIQMQKLPKWWYDYFPKLEDAARGRDR